jgi:hypothetical protein
MRRIQSTVDPRPGSARGTSGRLKPLLLPEPKADAAAEK